MALFSGGGPGNPRGLSVDTDPVKAWQQGQVFNATDLWKISSDDVTGIFDVLANATKRSTTHMV